MVLEGVVKRVDHVRGSRGERSWDYWVVRVFDDDSCELYECRVSDSWREDMPSEGEVIRAAVSIRTRRRWPEGVYVPEVWLERRLALESAARAS